MYNLQKQQGALAKGLDAIGQSKGLEQAAAMAGNLVDPLDRAGGAAGNVVASFGQKLMPAVNAAAEVAADFLNTLNGWINRFPTLSRWLGIIGICISTVAAGMGALALTITISKIAFGGFGGMLKFAVWGLTTLGKATKIFTIIQWAMNAAIWANPMTWIVLGVLLLIGAVVALVRWWDKIVAAFKNTAWGRAFFGIIEAIGTAIGWIIDAVSAVGECIGDVFGAVFDFIMAPFRALAKGVMWILEKLGIINSEAGQGPPQPKTPGPGPLGTGLNYRASPQPEPAPTRAPEQLAAARTENIPEGGVNKALGKTISQNANNTDNSTHIGEQTVVVETKLSRNEMEEMLLAGA
jgi:hypothetical protein